MYIVVIGFALVLFGVISFFSNFSFEYYIDERPATFSDIPEVCLRLMPESYKSIYYSLRDTLFVNYVKIRSKTTKDYSFSDSVVQTTQAVSVAIQEPSAYEPKVVYQSADYYAQEVASLTEDDTSVVTKDILAHFLKFRNEVFPKWVTLYWRKDTDYIYGYVQDVDAESKTLTLYIQIPDGHSFSAKYDHKVTAACNETNTILVASNLDVLQVGGSFWDIVRSKGFNIMSYCLDDACTSIGSACILIDTAANAIDVAR